MRILKINSLPSSKSWVDRDNLMLHACFQILEDCIEKENVDTQCDYESHKDFVEEVRFLYQWWQTRKKKNLSDKQMSEDDKMLIRLMKIRTSLWT
jgi:hypothetical protein